MLELDTTNQCAADDCEWDKKGKSKYCREHAKIARANFKAKIDADKEERANRYADFAAVVQKALAAGFAAGDGCTPEPMRIQGYAPILDGPCGFASIHFAGNTSFGRWAKKQGIARADSYRGGLYIWVGEFGQSYERKRNFARAYADVLNANGIEATSESRLD